MLPGVRDIWSICAGQTVSPTLGQSALQFQRQLGLSRYETAFQLLHKLRAGLVRPERDAIGDQHPVEVDERVKLGEPITASFAFCSPSEHPFITEASDWQPTG